MRARIKVSAFTRGVTVADLLRKQAAVRAESTAVEDARGVLGYRTIYRCVSRFACVLALRRDERWGEVPVAFVALKPGAATDAQALLQWCRAQLAGYKVPKDIRFVDAAAFPRSSTGKIQRHEIERQWASL
eukprot:gene42956-53297_t